ERGYDFLGQVLAAQLGVERHLPIGVQILQGAHQRPEQRDEVEVCLDKMDPPYPLFAAPSNLGKHALQSKVAAAELGSHISTIQTETARVWAPARYLDHEHPVFRYIEVAGKIRRRNDGQVAQRRALGSEDGFGAAVAICQAGNS